MLGESLKDPYSKEGNNKFFKKEMNGIGILPLKTIFSKKKQTKQVICKSLWPCEAIINGFEIHNGRSKITQENKSPKLKPLFNKMDLGWYLQNEQGGSIAGTYIHGIFENDSWRESYFNLIRVKKGLPILDKKNYAYKIRRDLIIDNLAELFKNHINLSLLLN